MGENSSSRQGDTDMSPVTKRLLNKVAGGNSARQISWNDLTDAESGSAPPTEAFGSERSAVSGAEASDEQTDEETDG
jgi:hypothetical protein